MDADKEANRDADSSAEADGCKSLIAMDAQKWRWYLENQGIVSSLVEEDNNESTKLVSSEASRRVIECLPLDAAIYQIAVILDAASDNEKEKSDDDSGTILDRLSLLHRCIAYDITTVQNCLNQTTSQHDAIAAKVDLFHEKEPQTQSDWKALCDKCGIPPSTLNVTTEKELSNSVDLWVEQKLRPSCCELVQEIFGNEVRVLRRTVANHDDFCRDKKIDHSKTLPLLSRIVSESKLGISDYETFQSLLLELEGLATFLKGRLLDEALARKTNTLSFMVQVAPDDTAELGEYLKTVETLLDKLRTTDSLVYWSLWEGQTCAQTVAHVHMARSKLLNAQAKVENAKDQLTPLQSKMKTLKEDLEWCQDIADSFRQQLEGNIGSLLDTDDPKLIHIQT